MPSAANASSNGSERALIRYRTAISSSATPVRAELAHGLDDGRDLFLDVVDRPREHGSARDSTVASSVLRNPPRCAASSFAKPRISGVER